MLLYLQRTFTFAVLSLALTLSAGAQAPGPGLQWQFYGDFDSNAVFSDVKGAKPTWSFQQNHTTLFVVSTQGTPVNVMADILHPADLFQFSFGLGPGMLTLGRVLIPFGTFDFHHIYGGRQDDSGTFLPKLWSDYGALYTPAPMGIFSSNFYIMNGMAPEGYQNGGASPRIYASSAPDTDLSKTLGARLKADILPNFSVVASGSWEPSLSMGGLDASWDLDTWSFKVGAIVQAVTLGGGGEEDDGFSIAYLRWADYAEAKWKFDWTMELRLRGGQMDTNTTLVNIEDQANVNLGLVWKLEQYELDLVYFRNFTLADPSVVGYTANYHQILLKVLVSI